MGYKETSKLNTENLAKLYREGVSAYKLAKDNNVNIWSIITRLRTFGVEIRPDGVEHTLQLTDDKLKVFTQLIDGLLLGDGYIHKKGYVLIEQASSRLGWLEQIQKELVLYNCKSTIIPISQSEKTIDNRILKPRKAFLLYTAANKELRTIRGNWYKPKKIVPKNFELSPLALTMWFCGDGTSNSTGGLTFCTDGFTKEDCIYLIDRFKIDYNIVATLSSPRLGLYGDNQYKINIHRKDEAVKLKEIVETYMPQCCMYKFRFVRPSLVKRSQ